MQFKNRIKKEMTEGIVRAILEDANYRVIDSGVEKVLREISILTPQEYKNHDYPEAIRQLPDLIVMDRAQTKKYLIEIKYRSDWNGELFNEIEDQVKIFKEMILISVNSNPPNPKNFGMRPSRYLRCCMLQHASEGYKVLVNRRDDEGGGAEWIAVDKVRDNPHLWWKMQPMQDVFTQITEEKNAKTLLSAIEALAGILEK
jgi:hypothetical protein